MRIGALRKKITIPLEQSVPDGGCAPAYRLATSPIWHRWRRGKAFGDLLLRSWCAKDQMTIIDNVGAKEIIDRLFEPFIQRVDHFLGGIQRFAQ